MSTVHYLPTSRSAGKRSHLIIGWREWIGLPALGITEIRTKIDTGQDISILRPFYIDYIRKQGQPRVHFGIHPNSDNNELLVHCEAGIIDHLTIRDDDGHKEEHPVINTPVVLGSKVWNVDMVLIRGEQMRFRALLGQIALCGNFLIDAGASFLMGHPDPELTQSPPPTS